MVGTACYFLIGEKTVVMVATASLVLVYAVCTDAEKGFLNNSVTRFVSGISMEIYLCHMFAYRVIEKLGWIHLVSSDLVSYCIASVLTLAGAIAFAAAAQWGIDKMKLFTGRMKLRHTNE